EGGIGGVSAEVLRERLGLRARWGVDGAGDDTVAAREVCDELGDGPPVKHARSLVVHVDVVEPGAQRVPLLAGDRADSGQVLVAHGAILPDVAAGDLTARARPGTP